MRLSSKEGKKWSEWRWSNIEEAEWHFNNMQSNNNNQTTIALVRISILIHIDSLKHFSTVFFSLIRYFRYSSINIGNHINTTRLSMLSSDSLNEPSSYRWKSRFCFWRWWGLNSTDCKCHPLSMYLINENASPRDTNFHVQYTTTRPHHTRPDQSYKILIVLRFFIRPQPFYMISILRSQSNFG